MGSVQEGKREKENDLRRADVDVKIKENDWVLSRDFRFLLSLR